jgi:hypothetical protein
MLAADILRFPLEQAHLQGTRDQGGGYSNAAIGGVLRKTTLFAGLNDDFLARCACAGGDALYVIDGDTIRCNDTLDSDTVDILCSESPSCAQSVDFCDATRQLLTTDLTLDDGATAYSVGLRFDANAAVVKDGICVVDDVPCDDVDNDCDDDVDETEGASCDTGAPGACAQGTLTCTKGGAVCFADAGPSDEVCNGVDDDCNDIVDDGLVLGGCDTGLEGICAIGQQTCEGAAGLVCVADVLPGTVEKSCNTLDDDYNGSPDDGGVCD